MNLLYIFCTFNFTYKKVLNKNTSKMKSIYSILLSVVLLLSSCASTKQIKDAIPEHSTFTIKSAHVHEDRIINVWLPEEYQNNLNAYPVMYMADGGVKEDFPHIAQTLAKLIKEKKIKPIILVGIENTQRRRDLTGFTEVEQDKQIAPVVGGSENFRAFIKNELIPEINAKYRTTNEKSIIGESASGLFVMETFFLAPEMFDKYIAFDPSLWWNNHYLVQTAQEHLANFPTNKKVLWFAGSNEPTIAPYTQELSKILQTKNLVNLTWQYADEPNEEHLTIFKATKEKALIWALNNPK